MTPLEKLYNKIKDEFKYESSIDKAVLFVLIDDALDEENIK